MCTESKQTVAYRLKFDESVFNPQFVSYVTSNLLSVITIIHNYATTQNATRGRSKIREYKYSCSVTSLIMHCVFGFGESALVTSILRERNHIVYKHSWNNKHYFVTEIPIAARCKSALHRISVNF